MTSISLPDPVVRHGGPPPADAGALERDLRRRVDGEVRFDAGSRGAYSTDASNYRQVPIGVVVPSTASLGQAVKPPERMAIGSGDRSVIKKAAADSGDQRCAPRRREALVLFSAFRLSAAGNRAIGLIPGGR